MLNLRYHLLSSDFLVPDYMSQMQGEEEAAALGGQYGLDGSKHHPVYAFTSVAAVAVTASSSSSVQMPVISQVSSSIQHSESSHFLSPELLDPPEAPTALMVEADERVTITEEGKTELSIMHRSSNVALATEVQPCRRRCRRAKEQAFITLG